MKQQTYLVGDIGGTNVRFALATSDSKDLTDIGTYKCADYATVEDALAQYLQSVGTELPDSFCLAAAGPVVNNHVSVTNNHWTIDAAAVRERFAVSRVHLLNDFEAVAWCVPDLAQTDQTVIGPIAARQLTGKPFRVAIVGPGTGFGAAGLVSDGVNVVPVVGEGGHMGFAPRTEMQSRVLGVLQKRFDVVSLERLVSGEGLRNIYSALSEIEQVQATAESASQVFATSIGGDPVAVSATEMFFELLGQFAGDFVLAYGAFDGVYIAGGIARRYPDMLQNGLFREAFEKKGKLRDLMRGIPTSLILCDEPGLLGAAAYLRR